MAYRDPPPKWVICDGSDFDVKRAPLLAQVYTDGKLPDLRGMFLRGLDPQGVHDSDGKTRKVGSYQKGSLLARDTSYNIVNFDFGDSRQQLGWDNSSDNFQEYSNPQTSFAGAAGNAQINNPVYWGISRPKNIACHWILPLV